MMLRFLITTLIAFAAASVVCAKGTCGKGTKVSFQITSSGTAAKQELIQTRFSQRADDGPWAVNFTTEISDCSVAPKMRHTTVTMGGPMVSPPEGYETIAGVGVYKFYGEVQDWEGALKQCAQDGAYLTVPKSLDAAKAVYQLHDKNKGKITGSPTYTSYVYIGINDIKKEGTWVPPPGYPVKVAEYINWGSGEPNGARSQNCCGIRDVQLYDDVPCSWKLSFVCEWLS